MIKERENLTPGYCNKLLSRDKKYFVIDANCPGLWLKVGAYLKDKNNNPRLDKNGNTLQGKKTWEYSYRPKGKDKQFLHLGPLQKLSPAKARERIKYVENEIFKGNDPVASLKKLKGERTLGEGIKEWYETNLIVSNGYKRKTIKEIKSAFRVWIFRRTDNDEKRKIFPEVDIQKRRLSSITNEMVKKLHSAIGGGEKGLRSPYQANRVVAYLKMFFNQAKEKKWCNNNPCKIKSKKLYAEKPYEDFLSKKERDSIYHYLIVKDERSGRLKKSYYDEKKLNPVACCLYAFQLFTGRRTQTEASSIKWSMVKWHIKKLILKETKTSKLNKKYAFQLGGVALDILRTIQKDKMNNEESRFFFEPGDERCDYVFPSHNYGKRIAGGIGKPNQLIAKTPHLVDIRKTIKKVLLMAGIHRHIKNYITRHTQASIIYQESGGDIKVVAEALGITEAQALTYAKKHSKALDEALEKSDQIEPRSPLRQVK